MVMLQERGIWELARHSHEKCESVPTGLGNLVVDGNGCGNFTTISEAVLNTPSQSMARFVIYIRKGLYHEAVMIGEDKWNITFIGDGIGRTILSSNRSNATGYGIKESGALVVLGEGFLAVNITFENLSGPTKGQAVAMRSYGDRSTFYKCSFSGYQDTLFTDKNKQFFRECEVYGAVDFIFGDAAVVFQNCKIIVRKPLQGQGTVITAQGRARRESNTGFVFQNCSIVPSIDLIPLKGAVKSYLGRPWKKFSRTIIMQSYIDDFVDPKGWREWDDSAKFLKTLVYKEYQNRGPGADTSRRVKWKGYSVIKRSEEAMQYIVESFIDGKAWLSSM